jgi:TLC domain
MNLEERIWGYTDATGLVQALTTGYFLFDLVVMIRFLKVFGLGMLAHALSCLLTYTLGFVGSISLGLGKCILIS